MEFILLIFIFFRSSHAVGEISRQKCEEYSMAVNVPQQSPLLLPNAGQNFVSGCGIVEVPLIVGGTAASLKEFPHMAVIGFGSNPHSELMWHCGGALISENYVLTAAHCLNSRQSGPAQKVRLGTVNLKSNDGGTYLIAERIPHPHYKPPSKYNDIGLLKMDNPIQFNAYIRPACLNTDDHLTVHKPIATGFGKLSYDSEIQSDNLMKVQLDIVSNSVCKDSFKTEKRYIENGITNSMICAGVLAGGRDTCQGDSGGPLQIVLERPYCMYSIVGITAFGKFCGFPNSPAVYSRVSHFLGWIEDVTWK